MPLLSGAMDTASSSSYSGNFGGAGWAGEMGRQRAAERFCRRGVTHLAWTCLGVLSALPGPPGSPSKVKVEVLGLLKSAQEVESQVLEPQQMASFSPWHCRSGHRKPPGLVQWQYEGLMKLRHKAALASGPVAFIHLD